MSKAVRKYLETYAEPEMRLASRLPRRYRNALVVPVFDERVSFLEGIEPAVRKADALCIVVVNAEAEAPSRARAANETLLSELRATLQDAHPLDPADSADPASARGESATGPHARAFLGRLGSSDVLVLDRTSPSSSLPAGEGVGLARKIGADLALALFARGKLGSDFIHTTDADVQLPEEYFPAADELAGDPAALTYPFRHVVSGEPDLDQATTIYEISLRSYVLALRWAHSPYAFHTVGSAVAVRAEAYGAVRGFPRRQAGEDFYLLNKLAKLGRIATPRGEPIRILARASKRVPFGTGPAVERIVELEASGEEHRIYHPACFAALHLWLQDLVELANHGDVDRWQAAAARPTGEARRRVESTRAEELRPLLDGFSRAQNATDALRSLCRQHAPGSPLLRHLHEWFDAFRTLKLVHWVRDHGFASVAWRDALRASPYVDLPPGALGEDADSIREALVQEERRRP